MIFAMLLVPAHAEDTPPDDAAATLAEAKQINADLDDLLTRLRAAQASKSIASPAPPAACPCPAVAMVAEDTLEPVTFTPTTPPGDPCAVFAPCARAASPVPLAAPPAAPLYPLGPVPEP